MRTSILLTLALTLTAAPAAIADDPGVCRLFAPHGCRPLVKPRAVRRVMPAYPLEARRRHIEGSVLVHVVIDRHGDVISAEADSTYPFLGSAALQAARQWHFLPMMIAGHTADAEITLEFIFRIDGGDVGAQIA